MAYALKQMLILACIYTVLSSPVVAQNHRDRWLCVVDTSVGLDYNKTTKKWEPAIFRSENKYILRYVDSTELNIQEVARNKLGLAYLTPL
jgi:hypothetical protein